MKSSVCPSAEPAETANTDITKLDALAQSGDGRMARRAGTAGYDPLSSDPGNPQACRDLAVVRSRSTNANVIEGYSRKPSRSTTASPPAGAGVAVPAGQLLDDARPCFHPGRRPMTSQALAGGLSVTGRILVAVLLGYALAYAVTACLNIYLCRVPTRSRSAASATSPCGSRPSSLRRAQPGAPAGCWRWPAWRWVAWPGSASDYGARP